MLYLISEILFSLMFVGAAGFAIGWWLRAGRAHGASAGAGVGDDREGQLDRAKADVAKLEAKLRELAPQSMVLDARVAELTAARGELEAALVEAQSQLGAMERELFARDASLAVLRERGEKLRAEAQAADGLTAELAAEREARGISAAELEALQAEHADCDFAFSALRDQIVALRRRVSEVESGVAPKARLAVAKKNGTTGTASGVASIGAARPTAAEAVRPTTLLDAPTRLPDDLKWITGLGFRLERKLNDLGVYYFQQIANLTPDEAAWIDAQLDGFRGNIHRDRWIEQAADLIERHQHLKDY